MTKLNLTNATWRKSSRSGNGGSGTCVEITSVSTHIAVRDSQNPHGGFLAFSPAQWKDLVRGVKHEEFDL